MRSAQPTTEPLRWHPFGGAAVATQANKERENEMNGIHGMLTATNAALGGRPSLADQVRANQMRLIAQMNELTAEIADVDADMLTALRSAALALAAAADKQLNA